MCDVLRTGSGRKIAPPIRDVGIHNNDNNNNNNNSSSNNNNNNNNNNNSNSFLYLEWGAISKPMRLRTS